MRSYSHWDTVEEYFNDMRIVINNCARVLKPGGFIAWNIQAFGEIDLASNSSMLLQKAGLKYCETIIWQKPLGMAGPRVKHIKARGLYYPSIITEFIFVYSKGKGNLNILTENQKKFILKKYQSNIWEIPPVIKVTRGGKRYSHLAPFPKALVQPLIIAYSKIGDIVLDPFSGMATTATVARELNRNYIMIEKNKEYFELGKRMLAQQTFGF